MKNLTTLIFVLIIFLSACCDPKTGPKTDPKIDPKVEVSADSVDQFYGEGQNAKGKIVTFKHGTKYRAFGSPPNVVVL